FTNSHRLAGVSCPRKDRRGIRWRASSRHCCTSGRDGGHMRTLREWIRRLWETMYPGRRDGDLEQELRSHLELAAEDAQRRGLDPDDAARAARIEAGGVSQAMDALRDQRRLPWLEDLVCDVHHGLRALRRTPVFASVAIVTLALGISANTAIFSIVNGVLLRPLAYPRPAQLMYLDTELPALGFSHFPASVAEYLEFQQFNRSFADVGAFRTGEANLMAGDRARRVRTAIVDAQLLNALIETWGARTGITPGPGHAGHVFLPLAKGSGGHILQMTPLAHQILGGAVRSIWVLQAAVGLVLLIACANVANLLLGRAETRQ